jgi:hypothetical protein
MSTIHLLQILETGSKIWALGSELFSITAILWALSALSSLIERVYRAGQGVGRFYYGWVHPLIEQIDWVMVGQIVWRGIIAVAVGAFVTERFIAASVHKANDFLAAAWVKLWVKPEIVVPVVAPEPAIHPIYAMQFELSELTCKQLRQIVKAPAKARKAELVAMALATV